MILMQLAVKDLRVELGSRLEDVIACRLCVKTGGAEI